MNDDPWHSARLAFKTSLLPALHRVGKRIGEKAQTGDAQAKRIIELYEMLHRSFDPLTFMQLEKALEEWIAEAERLAE